MSKRMIRMVASDVDGTLMRSDKTLSWYTIDTIHRAQEKGILFVICSGRYPEHADVLMKAYGIRCPIAGNNGCTLWDPETEKVLSDHFLSREAAEKACAVAEEIRLNYMVFGRKHVAARNAFFLHSSKLLYGDSLEKYYHIIFEDGYEAVQKVLAAPVNKFYFHYDTLDEKERLIAELRLIPDIEITTSGPANVEIIPKGCNKATGITDMARIHNIPMEEVMALGDYENDEDMLRAAGLGVAMGNASDYLKNLADAVTDTNDNDGVAKAIEQFAL